jgi:hypothetical protein
MATISSLTNLLGGSGAGAMTPASTSLSGPLAATPFGTPSGGGSIGGGGSAQDGLGQVNSGASTIASAIGQAQSALGGSSGAPNSGRPEFKKGGSVKKYTTSSGRLNLSAGGASTAQKNKKQSNW